MQKSPNKKPDPLVVCAIEDLLEALELDLDDPNLCETPSRVARLYEEIFVGIGCMKDGRIASIFDHTFPCSYRDMVSIKGISAWGVCPHHLLPVRYTVDVGYIPNKDVVGLSKIPRAVKMLAARPVLQEDFTHDIIQSIDSHLLHPDAVMSPGMREDGAIAVVRGEHMCMQMRGVKDSNSVTTTSAVSGIFAKDDSAKSEFLNLR